MQMCTTSTSGSRTISSAESKARSAPSAAAASSALAGEEAATPAIEAAGQTRRPGVDSPDEAGARDRCP